MTGRRPVLIALTAVLLIALALAVSVGDGSSRHGESPAALQPSGPTDARATARAAIERAAVAYQRALDPSSPEDPCAYMTPEAADDAMVFADPMIRARGCTFAVRAAEHKRSRRLYDARPPGVTGIQFLPRAPVAGIQGSAAGAQATWRADSSRTATFVKRDGQWLIAK